MSFEKSVNWADESANPFHGCRHGCSFCYARKFAKRHGGNPKQTTYHKLVQIGADPFDPCFSMERLGNYSAKWAKGKPRRIFLGSMGDLGGEWPYHYIDINGMITPYGWPSEKVRSTIARTLYLFHRHTFLILTKNPRGLMGIDWPSNVHVGISASTPDELAERLPVLFQVKASLRWASIEPLLSNDINRFCDEDGALDWVVVGAETGPGANEPRAFGDCAKRIVRLCKERGIPCFVKDNMKAADPGFDWPEELPEG